MKKYGTVLTEHIGLDSLTSDGQTQFSEQKIYTQDTNWIRESDIIIADVTQVSLGVGYELGFGESIGKRIICLYQNQSEKSLSAMIRGNDYFEIVDYGIIDQLPEIIEKIFRK